MRDSSRNKLNDLLINWPKGTVAAQTWLSQQGIPRQLADRYRQSNWIERIGPGAYTRTGDRVELLGAVYTLQAQLHNPVHVGGRTALELQGYAHFLPMGNLSVVHLYGRPGHPLPVWFRRREWGSQVRLHLARLFPSAPELGLTKQERGGAYSVNLSAPERAALELVELVPGEQPYDGARLLMESLTTLRPEVVQGLLAACKSVKAKRLFLHLAEKCGHAWLKQVDIQNVELGSGNRQIVRGGRLDPKYHITVPLETEQEVP
ncbi:MAG: type IV toxin-antitoxin system AbiEi family antitoxin [Elusimicrobia bacterium]|nr:type IV toxin-antitoxin system AbiEi family antitoxin [Elusimicrobiota bacterium]